jgi:hypothetical protein
LRETLKDVKIKLCDTQFLGYEILNESLKWLRIELRNRKNAPYEDIKKISHSFNVNDHDHFRQTVLDLEYLVGQVI